MRVSDEQARIWGLVKDEHGNWIENKKPRFNIQSSNPRPLPKPKPDICKQPAKKNVKQKETKGESRALYKIIVIARNMRDVDPDNICPKYYIDQIVEAGIVPDDSSKYVESITKRVEKVKTKEDEETIIEIYKEGK